MSRFMRTELGYLRTLLTNQLIITACVPPSTPAPPPPPPAHTQHTLAHTHKHTTLSSFRTARTSRSQPRLHLDIASALPRTAFVRGHLVRAPIRSRTAKSNDLISLQHTERPHHQVLLGLGFLYTNYESCSVRCICMSGVCSVPVIIYSST